jgi:hypothetical protein
MLENSPGTAQTNRHAPNAGSQTAEHKARMSGVSSYSERLTVLGPNICPLLPCLEQPIYQLMVIARINRRSHERTVAKISLQH